MNFTQFVNTFFFEDDWNAGHHLHIAYGVRYYIQTNPTFLNSAAPRLGILWSPDKKGRVDAARACGDVRMERLGTAGLKSQSSGEWTEWSG